MNDAIYECYQKKNHQQKGTHAYLEGDHGAMASPDVLCLLKKFKNLFD